MAYTNHTQVHAPDKGDISTRLNDRRSDVAARAWRRAVKRVGEKRAHLEINAAGVS